MGPRGVDDECLFGAVEFAFVSINHFFFVPITTGLAFLTALLQTAWYRTLGTVDLLLMLKYSREQLPPPRAESDADAPVSAVLY
jgi:hypothetical protein